MTKGWVVILTPRDLNDTWYNSGLTVNTITILRFKPELDRAINECDVVIYVDADNNTIVLKH